MGRPRFDELDIVSANGVGGGSLIYSNVTVEPHLDTSTNTYPIMQGWPLPLTPNDYNDPVNGAKKWMNDYRGIPSQVVTKFPPNGAFPDLKNLPPDQRYAYLGKSRWLKEASEKLGLDPQWAQHVFASWEPLNLAIIEFPDPTPDTTPNLSKKAYCERQGRCFMGCLPGARQTLNKTLISSVLYPANIPPQVEMRSLAEVTRIEKLSGGGYRVHYDDLRFGDHDAGRKKTVTAKNVVLSAGCIGTNHLMLRWKKNGDLNLSDMVGQRFSTNGDYAGFIDYRRKPNDPLNFNPAPFALYGTRGPINTSHVEFHFKDGDIFVNFEDAAIPPMLAPFVRAALDAVADAGKRNPLLNLLRGFWNLNFQDISESPDARKADQYMTEHELLQNTFFFNVMGRDRGTGVFSLDGHDELSLNFPDGPLSADPVYQRIEEVITALNQKMNGEYFRFPFWGKGRILNNDPDPDRKFVTVHPLGGCIMGVDANNGVVDTTGAVFDPSGGPNAVHAGLFIADAAVIPGPVAVNPTLSIVAMAKKIVSNIP